ncbi:PilX N-terminal domain-containing pilus assembly protein [Pseudomonas sp. R3.Fl]|uniref:pilus assembly PilX family protein n=1 Tax=Pseudomonas TaxID=286 RepID=UPI000E2FC328|nr:MULTISPECIES: PilX N-terminal domain-containing pilus assembly protein [Pseudomonas]MCL6690823.1 PilX N-terminal domain-containing pilus assembly protein [Pseudomonas sp. R3.Fl]MCP1604837.1 type IV pilus assembly protein PilX [Pseudomonas citronellolis]MCP1655003.1 type IV pilus assembly protein PilX [Pseudomonas citronellolis]MCP1725321.1 type IV pilus assembly protein PilX [Pseudomonas citronellolis]UUC49801.1 PilX N-terminal domain-containing pilus assembly protein [Pseudomonas citronell
MTVRASATAQGGAVLIVALVMLLLMTLLALSGISASQLEFRLAGNRAEQVRAFNAAESALRNVERRLADIAGSDDLRGASCAGRQGLCVLQVDSVRRVNAQGAWQWGWSSDPGAWWEKAQNAIDYDGQGGFERTLRQHAAYFASDGDGLNLGNLDEPQLRTDYYYADVYAGSDDGRTPVLLQSVFARRYVN